MLPSGQHESTYHRTLQVITLNEKCFICISEEKNLQSELIQVILLVPYICVFPLSIISGIIGTHLLIPH